MKTRQGDLIELALGGEFDVIVHGCNCFCRMERGIAAAIKKTFPEAYAGDLATPAGDRAKLGSLSWAEIFRENGKIIVVNAYTQHHWDGIGVIADYDAIRKAMREIRRRFSGLRIGYPKIGAGLARGNWHIIAAIIEEELAGEDHTCVEYAASLPADPEQKSPGTLYQG